MTNNYIQLASIDISEHIEKKQNLSYLSWVYAVDKLMRHDPQANWTFHDPLMFGETMMVSCTVTAFGKPITMHLPVMDHRNQAVKNPDSVIVNKNMMRCLVKAIACHGLGINVYAGEDLPLEDKPKPDPKHKEEPEPKEEKKPTNIAGKPRNWQLVINVTPEAKASDYVNIVSEMTVIALEQATSQADVMEIYKVNRAIFDKVKELDADCHKDLLDAFKTKKDSLK